MDLFSDELVSEVLGLLPPADRHALSAVCIQWDRVVRSMQRRLYIDFQQQPGASIGASGGGGEGSGGEEGASDDEGAAAAGSLLEGAALRTIVALVITGLKLPTQEEVLEELAEQLQPTLTQLALHWWHDRWSPGQLPQQGPPSQWIGSLTLLRRLTLGRSPQVPEQLTQLQALTHLGLHRCGDGREGHWSVPAGITALGQLRELQAWGTSLEGDMGALGCLPRLERLDLHESHVDSVGWLQGLTWLTFLRLNNLNNWVTVHAVEAWDAALRPLTLLRHLDLEATNLELLPPCAARLTALTALRLAFNTLRSLPPGPYLQSLLRLDLAYTSVKELPAPGSGGGAPGALHALRHLSFGCSDDALRDGPDRLPRFLAQVAALPGLKVLDVTDDYGMHHEEALAAALPAVAVDFYRLGCE